MRNSWSDPPERDAGLRFGAPALTPFVKRILFATVGVFLFQFALSFSPAALGAFERWFAIDPSAWKSIFLPIWQPLTYGFLHSTGSPSHILWNMLWLYFMGTMLEGIVGGRRFLAVYLGAMIVGGLLQLLFSFLTDERGLILGASGATLGITVAMATLRPHTTILLLFIPITLRTLAIVYVALDVFQALADARDHTGGVARFAHLGGAAFGFAAVRAGWIWRDPFAEVERRIARRREVGRVRDRERVDEILAKINREGIQSLTSGERSALKRASRRGDPRRP